MINKNYPVTGWRINWQVLGLLVILIGIISRVLIRDKPEIFGLAPMGADISLNQNLEEKENIIVNVYKSRIIYHLGLLYLIFGLTYSIYATFIVTVMVDERGFSEAAAGNFWSITGFLSLFSGPLFGMLSDKAGRRTAFIFVFIIQSISYLSAALCVRNELLYLSIFCFGITAWSIPCIMSAAVSDYAGVKKMSEAFGYITFIFGLGQISGPALAGLYADKTGLFSGVFYFSAALTAIAALLAAGLKKIK